MKNKKSFLYVMLTIAFPIALQNLLTTTASMVDTIMIGRLGESCVAAVGICSQISSLFFSCYWGFASASILFFSQYWGADDEKGINRTFGITFICMAIVGFAFASLCIIKPEFLLGVYTDKEVFIQIGKDRRMGISASGICCTYQLPAPFHRAGESTTNLFHRRTGSELLLELRVDIW